MTEKARQNSHDLPEHGFAIYQLKPEYHSLRFAGLSELRSLGRKEDTYADATLSVTESRYDLVYSNSLSPALAAYKTPEAILEGLYIRFNLNCPDDFHGHSLSISDVIVLNLNGQAECYYTDSFGFYKLPSFFECESPVRNTDKKEIHAYREAMQMYMDQSIESFENWRDSQYDRPQTDTETPNEQIPIDEAHDLNQPVVWKPIEPEKTDWLYSCRKEADAERGCIGHLRGDFGRSGTEFWTCWFDHQSELKSSAFQEELQELVNTLREPDGLLHDSASMRKGCFDGALGDGNYGFRAESGQYEYCLRCTPRRGDYNFYLYCYDKAAQREHDHERKSVLRQLKSEQKPAFKTEKNRTNRETER